jgi:CRISPR-associated protein Cmr1
VSAHMIDLRLELLSPCFLGGAFQQLPEFRIASLRGVWRYWYRALYGLGDEQAPGEEELKLFGGIAPRGAGGAQAAAVRILVLSAPDELRAREWTAPQPDRNSVNGRAYLFFSMKMNGRSFLEPGQVWRLRLLIVRRPGNRASAGSSELLAAKARTSLAAACAFSGLGARSRRMAGAVSLMAEGRAASQEFRSSPSMDTDDLAHYLGRLISGARVEPRRDSVAQYHVIAPGLFRAGVLKSPFSRWEDAIDAVGRMYADFRQHDPPGTQTRRQPDYGIAKAAAQGGPLPSGQTIRRAAFGLPIRFRFNSLGGRPVVEARPTDSDRSGSPFFLTLERLADGRLAVVWCRFKSSLTTDGMIRVDGATMSAPDSSLIDEMLERPEWDSHPVKVEL